MSREAKTSESNEADAVLAPKEPLHCPDKQIPKQPQLQQRSNGFKSDSVWKPLIRQFRRFLKKELLSASSQKIIRRAKHLQTSARLIVQELELPQELIS